MKPLLSVTITNFNYAELIGRAIESVQRQSFSDFEIVVVDNASTDGSVDKIRSYQRDDPRIRLFVNPENVGLSLSLKRSCDEARGIYRAHLDADDWIIDRDAFKLQIAMLESDPDISFVYSPLVLAGHPGEAIVVSRRYPQDIVVPGEVALESALMIEIVNSGPMMRMSAFRNAGGYNLDFMHAIDSKLAIDLCGQGKVGYINRPLYAFFQHPVSLARSSSIARMQGELERAIESAFTGPKAALTREARKLRRKALDHAFLLHGSQLIWRGQYLAGWGEIVKSVSRRPMLLWSPKPIVSLLLRTSLGERGWRMLRGLAPRGRFQT